MQNTGHMKAFSLLSEEAISKGIRRIVAITGPDAERVCDILLLFGEVKSGCNKATQDPALDLYIHVLVNEYVLNKNALLSLIFVISFTRQ